MGKEVSQRVFLRPLALVEDHPHLNAAIVGVNQGLGDEHRREAAKRLTAQLSCPPLPGTFSGIFLVATWRRHGAGGMPHFQGIRKALRNTLSRKALRVEPTGIEPATSWLQTRESTVASGDSKEVTLTPSAVCTRVCTSEGENANADALNAASLGIPPQAADTRNADQGNEGEGIDQGGTAGGSSTADQGDPLARLATELGKLSPADRERLAAMLTGH